MVEVFKTDVQLHEEAATLKGKLSSQFPQIKVNFDLEDCDKVLRVEGEHVAPGKIIEVLNLNGYDCRVME